MSVSPIYHLLQYGYISTCRSHKLCKFNMPKVELIIQPLQRFFRSRFITFSWGAYLYSVLIQAAITKPHRLCGFKWYTFTCHSSGGYKVQNQGSTRFDVGWEIEDVLLAVSWHGRERENKLSSFFFDTNPIIRVPPSACHLNLITSQSPQPHMSAH